MIREIPVRVIFVFQKIPKREIEKLVFNSSQKGISRNGIKKHKLTFLENETSKIFPKNEFSVLSKNLFLWSKREIPVSTMKKNLHIFKIKKIEKRGKIFPVWG